MDVAFKGATDQQSDDDDTNNNQHRFSRIPVQKLKHQRTRRNINSISVLFQSSEASCGKEGSKLPLAIANRCRKPQGVDSLAFATGNSDSETENDENNYRVKSLLAPVARKPKALIEGTAARQVKSIINTTMNAEKHIARENAPVWECSSLLTGLSIVEEPRGRGIQRHGVRKVPPIAKQSHHAEVQETSIRRRELSYETSDLLRTGLSSFVMDISDDDSQKFARTNRTTTYRNKNKSKNNNTLPSEERKDGGNNQHLRLHSKPQCRIQGRSFSGQNLKRIGQQDTRTTHNESDLCVAIQRNNDDSDESSQRLNHLLVDFHRQISLSKQKEATSKVLAPSTVPTSIDDVEPSKTNFLKSKRLIFTSPMLIKNRRNKRRDSKKTPINKSHDVDLNQLSETLPNSVRDDKWTETNLADTMLIDECDDTASSLSDESIFKTHSQNLIESCLTVDAMTMSPPAQFISPSILKNESQITPSNVDRKALKSHHSVIEMVDDNIDISKIHNLSIGNSDESDSIDICQEHASIANIRGIINASNQKPKLLRRSQRSRMVTNRFTITSLQNQKSKTSSDVVVTSNYNVSHSDPIGNSEANNDFPETHDRTSKTTQDKAISSADVVFSNVGAVQSVQGQQKLQQSTTSSTFITSLQSKESAPIPSSDGNKTKTLNSKNINSTSSTMTSGQKIVHNSSKKTLRRDRKKPDFFHNHHSTEYKNELTKKKRSDVPAKTSIQLQPVNDDTVTTIVAQYNGQQRESLETSIVEGWSTEQLQQLRDAQESIDPISESFWNDVAMMVQGKTASDCQVQWFSMVNTPAPKSKSMRTNVALQITAGSNDEDDIFQSTPMHGYTFSNAAFVDLFQMPKFPTATLPSDTMDNAGLEPTHDNFSTKVKPISKAYLQRMRRDFMKSEKDVLIVKNTKSQPKECFGKSAKVLTEVIRDHDIDINVRLTPNGTLKVKSQVDDDGEDDFWDDEYDADIENEDVSNFGQHFR